MRRLPSLTRFHTLGTFQFRNMRDANSPIFLTTETQHFSEAQQATGLVGAYNERPPGDSKVPPLGERAVGLMRSTLAGVHCNQREVRVQQYSAVLAQPSSQKVSAFRPLPQNAVLGPGVTPGT